jgi:hypothetical protein
MVAVELVREAMLSRAKNKRFTSYKEFALQMRRTIKMARDEDPAMAIMLENHLHEVTSLTFEHSWETAEEYHFRVMVRVEDGDWDLADGPDTYVLASVLQLCPDLSEESNEDSGEEGDAADEAC